MNDGLYVVQIKDHWWSSWDHLCYAGVNCLLGIPTKYKTISEAQTDLQKYKERMSKNGTVVWKDYE